MKKNQVIKWWKHQPAIKSNDEINSTPNTNLPLSKEMYTTKDDYLGWLF
jgi:hypothetical protein